MSVELKDHFCELSRRTANTTKTSISWLLSSLFTLHIVKTSGLLNNLVTWKWIISFFFLIYWNRKKIQIKFKYFKVTKIVERFQVKLFKYILFGLK